MGFDSHLLAKSAPAAPWPWRLESPSRRWADEVGWPPSRGQGLRQLRTEAKVKQPADPLRPGTGVEEKQRPTALHEVTSFAGPAFGGARGFLGDLFPSLPFAPQTEHGGGRRARGPAAAPGGPAPRLKRRGGASRMGSVARAQVPAVADSCLTGNDSAPLRNCFCTLSEG